MKNIVQFVKSAIEHNERTGELLQTILNEIQMNDKEYYDNAFKDILEELENPSNFTPIKTRELDSMQMIESILDYPQAKLNTIKFITGLRDHLNSRRTLSESQRFHLESTFNSLFGDE